MTRTEMFREMLYDASPLEIVSALYCAMSREREHPEDCAIVGQAVMRLEVRKALTEANRA